MAEQTLRPQALGQLSRAPRTYTTKTINWLCDRALSKDAHAGSPSMAIIARKSGARSPSWILTRCAAANSLSKFAVVRVVLER